MALLHSVIFMTAHAVQWKNILGTGITSVMQFYSSSNDSLLIEFDTSMT
jgi:hypothetical protein